MKRANKYDKSVSQKQFMITRSQRELKWLKSLKPKSRQSLKFNLDPAEKSSLDVLEFRGASLSFESLSRPILSDVGVSVRRGQKIGVIGPNGAGKTTLLSSSRGTWAWTRGSWRSHRGCRSATSTRTTGPWTSSSPRPGGPEAEAQDGVRRPPTVGQFQFTKEMVRPSSAG